MPTTSNVSNAEEKETDQDENLFLKDEKPEQKSEPASSNPTLAENECGKEDLERLKGDAIGDTLYSERFVLNTLLKLGQLNKDLQEADDVERDLCSLWDMTIEGDIVNYLLDQGVMELFAGIINSTEDKRLTEILVGILANMCNCATARKELEQQPDIVQLLLDLIGCMDSLTLEQLMRLLAAVFVKMEEEKISIWFNYISKSECFTENICFILTNAANNSLILQTLETLNAILAKFSMLEISIQKSATKSFEDIFVKSSVIQATIESFQSLHKDTYEAYEIPEDVIKANQTFCNIHSILAQYGEMSRESYKTLNDEMLSCLKDVLKPIAEDSTIVMWQQYEQDVMESVNDILRVLPCPFDIEISQYLLKIFFEVSKSQEEKLKKPVKNDDFEDDTDDDSNELDYQGMIALILNTIYYLILMTDKEMLAQCVSICPRKYTVKVMESFPQPLEVESLKVCFQKLKDILKIDSK